MTTGANSKDPRLLGALDNLDPRFIAEVTDSLRITSVTPTPGRKRAAMVKSVRYIIALAACVLLLSAIIPTVSYLINNNFIFWPAGSIGEETTSDPYDPESIDTTVIDREYAYDYYGVELEPLTQEQMKELSIAAAEYHYQRTLNNYLLRKPQEGSEYYEEDMEEWLSRENEYHFSAKQSYCYYANEVLNGKLVHGYVYLGTFDGYIVMFKNELYEIQYDCDGFTIRMPGYLEIYKDGVYRRLKSGDPTIPFSAEQGKIIQERYDAMMYYVNHVIRQKAD